MAEMRGLLRGKSRQRPESLDLVLAMKPGIPLVQNQNETPIGGKLEAGDHRRDERVFAAPPVDYQAALFEYGNTDTGACPALDDRREISYR